MIRGNLQALPPSKPSVGSAVVVGSFVALGYSGIRRLFNPANQTLQPTRPRLDVSYDP